MKTAGHAAGIGGVKDVRTYLEEDLDVKGKTILNASYRNKVEGCQVDSSGLSQVKVAGSYGHTKKLQML